MARLRYNGLTSDGTARVVTLAAGGTIATFVNPLPGVATIVTPDILILTVGASTPQEEIIALTAYTAGTLTATCIRNYEATVEGQNSSAAHSLSAWSHDTVASDYGVSSNEVAASVLVNATSAGAAAIADHFDNPVLNAAWINEGGAATFVTGKTVVGFATAANGSQMLRPWTPTGILRFEARLHGGVVNGDVGLLIKDTGVGEASGNGVLVQTEPPGTLVHLYSFDAGTYNSQASLTCRGYAGGWIYLRIDRDGSNNWSAYHSVDRSTWVLVGTFAKTFTVAKVGIRTDDAGSSCDFFDVVL